MQATQVAAWLAVLVVGVGVSSVLGGVAYNLGGSQTQYVDAANKQTSLVNASPQVGAGVNVLNSVQLVATGAGEGNGAGRGTRGALNNIGGQQIQNSGTQILGSGNKVSSLLNVGPQLDVDVNALNKVEQNAVGLKGAGTGGSNNIGDRQILNDGTTIQGNQNTVSSLLNLNPQLDVDVNLLNTVKQLLKGDGKGSAKGGGSNNIGDSQILNDGTTIQGNQNTVSSLLNLNPQLDVDVNLLNSVKQLLKGDGKVSAKSAGGALNNIGDRQIQNTGTNIVGSGNKVSSLLDVAPQLNAGVNALNKVEQDAVGLKGAGAGGSNNIGNRQILNDGTNIQGNQNTVSSLLNLNPQLDVDVNLLNSVKQLIKGDGKGSAKSAGSALNNIGDRQIQNTGTNIVGSGNKVSSLLNVAPQLNAGVNALNKVEQDGVGLKGAGAGGSNNIGNRQILNDGTNIQGNQNTVSSLLNLNPQLDVDVNLLNSVKQLLKGDGKGSAKGGGSNNIGDSQILNDGTTIQGNQNTVSSLLNLNPQLDVDVNLLNTVKQLIKGDGKGSAKSAGGALNNIGDRQIQNTGTNIVGSGNKVSSLLDVAPQLNAGVNALNKAEQDGVGLKGAGAGGSNNIGNRQILNDGTNIQGNQNTVSSLLNLNPQLDVDVNLLNSVKQLLKGDGKVSAKSAGGALNNIGDRQIQNTGTNIVGSGNKVSSLLDVAPQLNAGVNALNKVEQDAVGLKGAGAGGSNNIGGSQTQHSGTNIVGSGNTVSSLLNVAPQVDADINLLNSVKQVAGGSDASNIIGGSQQSNSGSGGKGSGAGNNIGSSQIKNSGTNIAGSGNTVASLLNVNPQVGAAVNLLNVVNQAGKAGGNSGSGGSGLGSGNNIGGSQTQLAENTGKNIIGNKNTVAELINLNPQVGVGVNALNSVQQTATGLTGGKSGAANNIGSQQTINDGTSIVGDNNKVLSLANVKPQIGVDVNLLNSVTQGGKGGAGKDGLLGGVVGGLLGGDGPVGGLLEGDGPVGGLLGSDGPVGGLLGGDGPVGGLLGGKGPVGGLLGGDGPVGGLLGGDGPVGGLLGGDGPVGGLLGGKGPVGGLLGGNGPVGGLLEGDGPVGGLLGGEGPVGGLLGGDGPVGGLLGGDGPVGDLLGGDGPVGGLLGGDGPVGGLLGGDGPVGGLLGGKGPVGGLLGGDGPVGGLLGGDGPVGGLLGGNGPVGGLLEGDGPVGGLLGGEGPVGGLLGGDGPVGGLLGGEGPVRGLLGGDGPVGGLLGGDGPVGGLLGGDGPVGGLLGGDGPVGGLLGGKGPVGGLLGGDGPVGGLLGGDGPVGGLLGGDGPVGGLLGGKGPVGGLLGGDGPVGGLLGGDGPVGGLLGGDGPVGGLLGGDGPVGGLLGGDGPVGGLLGGEGPVGGLIGGDGPVGGLLGGGGNNQIGSQQLTNDGTIIRGDNNQVSSLANVKPQIGVNLQLLNQVQQAVGGLFPHPKDDSLVCQNFIGGVQQQNSGTNIVGDGNKVITGIDVSPQINLDLNLLNNVRQVVICRPRVKPTLPTVRPPTRPPTRPTIRPPTKPPTRPPITLPTIPPNPPTRPPIPPTEEPCIEINNIGGTQEQLSGTSIVGDGNRVLSGINVNPQVALGVNLLNNVQQTQQGRPVVICKPKPPTPTVIPPTLPPTLPPITPTPPTRRCYVRYCRRWGHKLSYHCCDNCLPPAPITPPPILPTPILPPTPRPYPILPRTPRPRTILPPTLPPPYLLHPPHV